MQATHKALVICPDIATVDVGIHASSQVLDRSIERRRAARLFALPAAGVQPLSSDSLAAEPRQRDCARQLCLQDGLWQLRLQQLGAEEQQTFVASFASSLSAQIGTGTPSEAQIFSNVRMCALEGGVAVCAQSAASDVDLILPRESACVVLSADLNRVAPLLRAHMLAAERCPTSDDVHAVWPSLLADPHVQTQCAPSWSELSLGTLLGVWSVRRLLVHMHTSLTRNVKNRRSMATAEALLAGCNGAANIHTVKAKRN